MKYLVTLTAMTALMTASAVAQDYPSRTITLIVPFAAGGSSDLIARAVAEKAEQYLGQSMVVVNRPGGSTNVGLSELVEAEPDGYTLGTVSPAMTQQFATGATSYNYVQELTAVGQISNVPYVLAVDANTPFQSLDNMVAFARDNPHALKYGTAGAVSATYSSFARFGIENDILIDPVHFDGGARAMAAMLGGHVQASWQAPSDFRANVEAGSIRPLAVAGEDRMEGLYAEVPTFREQGYEVIDQLWTGLAAPAGLPPDVLARLEYALEQIVSDPDTQQKIAELGLRAEFLDGAGFAEKWVAQELRFLETLELLEAADPAAN